MRKGQADTAAMNDRRCIVTGQSDRADRMIRFVAGPDGAVVPDIKRNLPGRGCWVTARRDCVDKAAAKTLFARALKSKVSVPADLGGLVDDLLARHAVGALAMARKAGHLVSGASKVDNALRAGKAIALLHAREAAADGVRKLDQARRATVHLGGPDVVVFALLSAEQMGLAFAGGNAIHAAVLDGRAGDAALRRLEALRDYRSDPRERPTEAGHGSGGPMKSGDTYAAVEETDQARRIRNE